MERPIAAAAATIALVGAATLVGAWLFQYGLNLAPCPLCLEQRIPYYVGVPLAVVIGIAAGRGAPRTVLTGALLVLALVFLWSAWLGAYHAGVEWKWWAGPQDCAVAPGGGGIGTGGSLLQQMQRTRVVPCDDAAWRFLGLSLAGWNFLISLTLAAVAVAGIAASRYNGPQQVDDDDQRRDQKTCGGARHDGA